MAAKTKVAPLQSISIPHLELIDAVLGIRLARSIINALSLQAELVTFWTDSAMYYGGSEDIVIHLSRSSQIEK